MRFLDSIDPVWLEQLHQRWRTAPESVPVDWQVFFAGYALAADGGAPSAGPEERCRNCSLKQSGVQSLLYRYRDLGHLLACTDPLSPCKLDHPLLALSEFGLDGDDLDTVFTSRRFYRESATLREILATLQTTYCRAIGVEFMYIVDPVERQWLIDRMEPVQNRTPLGQAEQVALLGQLQAAALFEAFLHRRFPGQKRFSLEGAETLIVLLEQVIATAAGQGVTDVVLGMAHRGRLNVLANILGKPLANIFAEFTDSLEQGFVGDGDVKYHKGYSADRVFAGGQRVHLTLAFNPSHLEVVDPVVTGKARALQDRLGTSGRRQVLPLLVHGDAAFAGQGVVAETLNLSQLEGYGTGGTVHLVLNNQIGFTTLPRDARSTRYATDVARMLMIPIFHVHGENPEAVAHVARLAAEYRQTFGRDVVVELVCYRRHGHNEGDEPYFTQPDMYARIKERPPVHRLYADQLQQEGVAPEVAAAGEAAVLARLEAAFAQSPDPAAGLGFAGQWQEVRRGYEPLKVATGAARSQLVTLGKGLTEIPAGFEPHPKVAALLERRQAALAVGSGLDWGCAEALAFATLLAEGTSVRLSGQDSCRGTFNHRHAVLHDQRSAATWTPLAALARNGAQFSVYDSALSENAVLGYEYGYALASPQSLVLWEAQFGDFANGAQPIIDQFIASGESKWDRSCGLVLLLPHGYEGQGAEHSSARIERFLQLTSEQNLLVVNPSTPAQLFHLFRRQVLQPFRKPLVVFTPKSLLRHPACVSDLDELAAGWFREVLTEAADYGQITQVLFCSGKIYYDLVAERQARGHDNTIIIRIEQLYPLRQDLLREALAPLRQARRFVWVQEEPANMGAWGFLRGQLADVVGSEPEYCGRSAAAAPAVGSHRQHGLEQQRIVTAAYAG
jgi:2-oxoglutarate dehydrogenase E1 component